MLRQPCKYFVLLTIRNLLVPRFYKTIEKKSKLFFGGIFIVDLPAHADIFLYGCKVNDSDFLLQNYLNANLKPNVVFFDIGASLGYYSLFVSNILQKNGFVYAFEPSKTAFDILNRNTLSHENINTFNIAIGNVNETSDLFEFPTRYNEYNTIKIDSFIERASWSKSNPPVKRSINMRTLDSLIDELKIVPDIIKLDIEGSEELLFAGMIDLIKHHSPDLIMRFWPSYRNNVNQLNVIQKLQVLNYKIYSLIDNVKIEFNELSDYNCEYLILKKTN